MSFFYTNQGLLESIKILKSAMKFPIFAITKNPSAIFGRLTKNLH